MGFNYGLEKKKFEAEWKKIRKEYEEAGMSEVAINAMYEYDLNAFNKRRSVSNHEQQIPGFDDMDSVKSDTESPLLLRCAASLATEDTYSFGGRFDWIEEFSNESISKKIYGLSDEDKELLTLVFFDEFTIKEIAAMKELTVQGVHYHLNRIKKFLNSL